MATTDDVTAERVEPGVDYRPGEPVVVHVRRRGARVDIDDDGTAVSLSGRPTGWLALAEQAVLAQGFNVNRRGAVFVPVTADRDVDDLARRLAACSREVYLTLLDAR